MESRKKGRKVVPVAGLALVVLSVAMVWTYRKEIRFFLKFERLVKNAQGYSEYRHRETGIVMVRLPGGTFLMGSPETEADREDGEEVHKVRLSPFLIAKYEVTQSEWKTVMGNNPSRFKGDTLPVENVSWDDCQEVCKKTGLSLPTEAQWEYACRAGTSGPFAGMGKIEDMAWYKQNTHGTTTHPVGEKLPNDFGLHDMHGNVWELCEDWYQKDFYQESTGARDPLCETLGSEDRVVRGGGWGNYARYCRSACRGRRLPSMYTNYFGFRPAWSSP